MKIMRILFIALLMALAGCGWHLRGMSKVGLEYHSIYVQSQGAPGAAAELAAQLRNNGVNVTADPHAAEAVIVVSNEKFDRRVLSVDTTTGKAREFELGYQVTASAHDTAGKTILQPETVTMSRDYSFDEGAVLGTYQQEQTLQVELRRDAADQILRRLNAGGGQ